MPSAHTHVYTVTVEQKSPDLVCVRKYTKAPVTPHHIHAHKNAQNGKKVHERPRHCAKLATENKCSNYRITILQAERMCVHNNQTLLRTFVCGRDKKKIFFFDVFQLTSFNTFLVGNARRFWVLLTHCLVLNHFSRFLWIYSAIGDILSYIFLNFYPSDIFYGNYFTLTAVQAGNHFVPAWLLIIGCPACGTA